MTEGRKDDAGKPRPTLVFGTMAQALAAVVEVAEYGARKYAPDNWLLVPDGLQRYSDALLRHALAALRGEVLDPESGLRHTAHMAWCALVVLELRLREAEELKRGRGVLARREGLWARWAAERYPTAAGVAAVADLSREAAERLLRFGTAVAFKRWPLEVAQAVERIEKLPEAQALQRFGLLRFEPVGDDGLAVCVEQARYTVSARYLNPGTLSWCGLVDWLKRTLAQKQPQPQPQPQPSVQHVIDELSKLPAVRELQEAGLIEFKWQHGDADSLTAHVGAQVFPITTAYSKPAFERWVESLRPSRKLQADAEETLAKLVNPGSLAARAVDAGLIRARYRWSSKQPAVYVELLRGDAVLASTKAKVTGDGVPMAVSQAFEAFCNLPRIHTIVEGELRAEASRR